MASESLALQFVDLLVSRLDEMATSLMVMGVDGISVQHLDSFSHDAKQNGLAKTANEAMHLAERLRTDADPESMRETLENGLGQLRLTLEHESSEVKDPVSDPVVEEKAPASIAASFAEDREFITDFISEAREHLSSIESQMLDLEKNPGTSEVLNSVFRGFHTIKGLAGFLELDVIQTVSHQVETLLDLARSGKLTVTGPIVDMVLESSDYLKADVGRIESELNGAAKVRSADNHDLIRKIERAIATAGSTEAPSEPVAIDAAPAPVVDDFPDLQDAMEEPQDSSVAKATEPREPGIATETAKTHDNSSVRVETAKLDLLLDMVGEMVIAQSLIRNNPALMASSDMRLLGDVAQLTRNTADVQRITMGMRMIPIGQLFNRTARLIRDLSRKAGKQIILETIGEDTEVDKTIAEELSDPLLHMVRNSVDHGIETPQERAATGKDPVARIVLKAYHRAGQIVIEISDDGRGLNRSKILAKAKDRGLIDAGDHLSDTEVYHLIFEPGFSTAEKITDVSGRGVGMDVVRRNVQKLRGRIDIQSVFGQGTMFSLKLPLTLAIIDGLVVVVGANRYIVPLFAVREMFRPTEDMLSTVQGRGEMALVRGKLLPITRLSERLGIPAGSVKASDGFLVVVECDDKQFCLLVDDLVGKQEVVIKSLGQAFKDAIGLAGCAILGDGRIGLILDMEGIYRGRAR